MAGGGRTRLRNHDGECDCGGAGDGHAASRLLRTDRLRWLPLLNAASCGGQVFDRRLTEETMQRLDGKVAVVAGGASGIGRAVAERFMAEGMAVVVADVEQPVLDSMAEAMRKAGGEVLAVPTDARDPSSVEALAQAP